MESDPSKIIHSYKKHLKWDNKLHMYFQIWALFTGEKRKRGDNVYFLKKIYRISPFSSLYQSIAEVISPEVLQQLSPLPLQGDQKRRLLSTARYAHLQQLPMPPKGVASLNPQHAERGRAELADQGDLLSMLRRGRSKTQQFQDLRQQSVIEQWKKKIV